MLGSMAVRHVESAVDESIDVDAALDVVLDVLMELDEWLRWELLPTLLFGLTAGSR